MAIQTSWDAGYLRAYFIGTDQQKASAFINQDRIWVTAAGDVWNIDEMNSAHLLNTLLFFERVARDVYAEVQGVTWLKRDAYTYTASIEWLVDTNLYKALKEEVYNRMTNEFVPDVDDRDEDDPTADLDVDVPEYTPAFGPGAVAAYRAPMETQAGVTVEDGGLQLA